MWIMKSVICIVVIIMMATSSLMSAQTNCSSAYDSMTNTTKESSSVRKNMDLGAGEQIISCLPDFAVMRSLRWLKKKQNQDGSWGDDIEEPKSLVTSIALLAFLCHGDTLDSPEFGSTIKRSLKYLLSTDVQTSSKAKLSCLAVEHGIRARVLCEVYAMTGNSFVLSVCTNALNVIIAAQRPSGLWNMQYSIKVGQDDAEASCWQMMALRSAIISGIKIDGLRPALIAGGKGMLNIIQDDTVNNTNVLAVLCIQLAGLWHGSIRRTNMDALNFIPVDWDKPKCSRPVCHWYFMTQALFREGGTAWRRWHTGFSPQLVQKQSIVRKAVKIECRENEAYFDIGYWDSPGSNEHYGRIYSTSLCCLMLEVYYSFRSFFMVVPEDDDIGLDLE